MKRRNLVILVFILCISLLFTSCNRNNPTQRPVAPREYSLAYFIAHGHCYDSVSASVLSLDLYSDGLWLDSTWHIQGTGYNLYFSDIFIEDSTLQSGDYHSDTTGALFTFLPGRNYEGMPSGTYLLRVNDGSLESIVMMDSGRVEVRDTLDGIADMCFTLYYGKECYEAHFQGPLVNRTHE